MIERLRQALKQNDRETFVKLLDEHQPDPLLTASSNEYHYWPNLLQNAMEKENTDYFELLLSHTERIFLDKDHAHKIRQDSFQYAWYNGLDEYVLTLLQKGCNPNDTMNDGITALAWAAHKGYMKTVEHLINFSADINAKDVWGSAPIHAAVQAWRIDICRYLLNNGADLQPPGKDYPRSSSPLHNACELGYVAIARLLLEHDSTIINSQDYEGKTPLMCALPFTGPIKFIQYLLDNGAQTEFHDESGLTTLHYAIKSGRIEKMALILQSTDIKWIENVSKNALIQFKGKNYSPLLHEAIDTADDNILSIILTSGLPTSILQSPMVQADDSDINVQTPLTYLFEFLHHIEPKKFEKCLHLLLKYEITILDEFNKVVQMKWHDYGNNIKFHHPFSKVFTFSDDLSEQLDFMNLLNKYDIHVDYCLQWYCDTNQPFTLFDAYNSYYEHIIQAMITYNIETLKAMIPNSAILEPDKLLVDYFFSDRLSIFDLHHYTYYDSNFMDYSKAYQIYQYLISLKPLYYKQVWRPSLENVSSFQGQSNNREIWKRTLQERPSSFSENEEFSTVTLQQLCRTVIRQQVRLPTVQDNLLNFQKNILKLPLPNSMKDYLLFKS